MPIRKNSKKRQVILEALAATTAHPTAQELYQQLKPDYPDLSLGTVYRNLSLFAKQGDVMSVGVFRGQERFDARTEPHAHLHCVQCGRVIDVPLPGEPEPQLCAPRPERDGCKGARVQHHVHGAVQDLSASGQGSRFQIKQPTIEIKKL